MAISPSVPPLLPSCHCRWSLPSSETCCQHLVPQHPHPHHHFCCWQVPAGAPPDGGSPLAAQQQWQWWQLCGAAVALMAVAVPMLLLWLLQSLALPAAL